MTSTPVPNTATVLPLAEIALRWLAVSTPRHPTNNDQTLRRQVAREALGHARSVGRGMACPNHGDAGLGQRLGIAANAQDQRRIVDFFQARRVRGIVHREQRNVSRGGLGDLFPSQFCGLASGQRLRRDSLNAGGFKFGQRSAEPLRGSRSARPVCATSLVRGRESAKWPATPQDGWRSGARLRSTNYTPSGLQLDSATR